MPLLVYVYDVGSTSNIYFTFLNPGTEKIGGRFIYWYKDLREHFVDYIFLTRRLTLKRLLLKLLRRYPSRWVLVDGMLQLEFKVSEDFYRAVKAAKKLEERLKNNKDLARLAGKKNPTLREFMDVLGLEALTGF